LASQGQTKALGLVLLALVSRLQEHSIDDIKTEVNLLIVPALVLTKPGFEAFGSGSGFFLIDGVCNTCLNFSYSSLYNSGTQAYDIT